MVFCCGRCTVVAHQLAVLQVVLGIVWNCSLHKLLLTVSNCCSADERVVRGNFFIDTYV
jgi:hypothetical protein